MICLAHCLGSATIFAFALGDAPARKGPAAFFRDMREQVTRELANTVVGMIKLVQVREGAFFRKDMRLLQVMRELANTVVGMIKRLLK